jgi:hypothetical protein
MPNAVKTIKNEAFCRCTRLTTVTPGERLEAIEACAFYKCISLECIVIPNAVKTSRYRAFYKCRGLTTVTLGEGLEQIVARAFSSCKSLE